MGNQGVELSKPTLSQHLKHLADEKKLIIRKVEEAQNVTYEINHKKFSNLEKKIKPKLRDIDELRKAMDEEEGAFYSEPIDDQVKIVHEEMILRNLQQLKTRIELESNPGDYEKSIELMIISRFYRIHERWLAEKCMREKEYREKVFQKIDELIKKVEDQYHGTP